MRMTTFSRKESTSEAKDLTPGKTALGVMDINGPETLVVQDENTSFPVELSQYDS